MRLICQGVLRIHTGIYIHPRKEVYNNITKSIEVHVAIVIHKQHKGETMIDSIHIILKGNEVTADCDGLIYSKTSSANISNSNSTCR